MTRAAPHPPYGDIATRLRDNWLSFRRSRFGYRITTKSALFPSSSSSRLCKALYRLLSEELIIFAEFEVLRIPFYSIEGSYCYIFAVVFSFAFVPLSKPSRSVVGSVSAGRADGSLVDGSGGEARERNCFRLPGFYVTSVCIFSNISGVRRIVRPPTIMSKRLVSFLFLTTCTEVPYQ